MQIVFLSERFGSVGDALISESLNPSSVTQKTYINLDQLQNFFKPNFPHL